MTRVRHLDDAEAAAAALRDVPLDPVIDTVLLGVLDRCLTDPTAYPDRHWWIAEDEQGVVGAAFQTRPWALGLAMSPGPWLDDLVDALLDYGWSEPEVAAKRDRAEAFANRWTARTGDEWTATEQLRLLRCHGLVPPTGVTGHGRLARVEETPLLAQWLEEFTVEVDHVGQDFLAQAGRLLGHAWLWLDGDDEPVSFAAHTSAQRGVARVGPVYTPPAQRRQGYAGAVTAAATQAAYDQGAEHVVLYTDATNPTSNGVYERLGYVHEQDAVHLRGTGKPQDRSQGRR